VAPISFQRDLDRTASAVLGVVLDCDPAQMSLEEILREVASDPADAGERCDIADAIQELARAGLVHRSGPFVFASRAAVRASELSV
jgi:hypothetical protein